MKIMFERRMLIQRCRPQAQVAAALFGLCCLLLSGTAAPAYETLGIGTEFLIGNDLTDLGDDGDPEFDEGYDAIFDSNHEPGFGSDNADPNSAGAGESAFNVFDNLLGPANDKWCCGRPGGIFEDDPIWVSAQLPVPHFLTAFTVSSANDAPNRDPIYWAVQGSNDGQDYTDIYVYEDDFGPWVDRYEVIVFTEGEDFPVQTTSYEYFRFATYDTINNQVGDPAYFQVGEIEYFGRPGDDVLNGDFNGNGVLDSGDIDDLTQQSAFGTNPGPYDLNADALVDATDINIWIEDLQNSWIGDANLDGEFNTSDLVQVLAAGTYEQDVAAVWTTGDFTGDGRADSSDLVAALSGGGYEAGTKAAVAAVPEPSAFVLILMGTLAAFGSARRRK